MQFNNVFRFNVYLINVKNYCRYILLVLSGRLFNIWKKSSSSCSWNSLKNISNKNTHLPSLYLFTKAQITSNIYSKYHFGNRCSMWLKTAYFHPLKRAVTRCLIYTHFKNKGNKFSKIFQILNNLLYFQRHKKVIFNSDYFIESIYRHENEWQK